MEKQKNKKNINSLVTKQKRDTETIRALIRKDYERMEQARKWQRKYKDDKNNQIDDTLKTIGW